MAFGFVHSRNVRTVWSSVTGRGCLPHIKDSVLCETSQNVMMLPHQGVAPSNDSRVEIVGVNY